MESFSSRATARQANDGMQMMNKNNKQYLVGRRYVSNEDGVVLVTALLILVVLTLMGVAAMSIRNTERSITMNNEVSQHNFYVAEAVTLEGASAVEQLPDTVLSDPAAYPLWLKVEDPAINLELSSQWPSGLIAPRNTTLTGPASNIVPNGYNSDGTAAGDRIWTAVIDGGVAAGSSVTYSSGAGGTTKQERIFDVYGMYDVKPGAGKSYHGKKMMVVGYKKQIDMP